MSDEIAKTLHAGVVQALAASDVQKVIEKSGSDPASSSGDELEQFLKRDSTKWQKVIENANVRIHSSVPPFHELEPSSRAGCTRSLNPTRRRCEANTVTKQSRGARE